MWSYPQRCERILKSPIMIKLISLTCMLCSARLTCRISLFSVLTVTVCCYASLFELLDIYALIFHLISVIIPPFLLSPPLSVLNH